MSGALESLSFIQGGRPKAGDELIPGRFDVDTSKPLKRRAAHIRGPWLRAKSGAGAQRASQVSMSQAHRDLV